MKPTPRLRHYLAALGGSILAISSACAADGTWTFGTGNGNWSDTTKWQDNNADTIGDVADGTDSTAFFTAEFTGARTVTVDTPRTIGNITFTDTTPNNNLTIAGTGANILTLDRTGTGVSSPSIDVTQAGRTLQINAQISGDDGLAKAGDGILILNNSSNNHTGKTVVTDGILQIGTAFNAGNLSVPGGYTSNPVTGSNIELNGGILSYWFDFARTLGTGDGQIQLTGGVSGFTQKQGDRTGLVFGTAGSEIQWGGATFNPTTLVLNDSAAVAAAPISFNNALDLNGANRTVATNSTALTANNNAFGRVVETGALLNYNMRNTSGTAAALIKTGAGKLALDGTNTYDGGTTINQGGVLFDNTVSMPATGTVTVNDGTELIVSVGNAGEWTTGTSGVGTLGGLLSGDGGQTAAQVSYSGNVTVGVNTTTNQTYAGDIANVTGSTSTGLSVYADDGSGQLELTGNNSYTGATRLYDGATLLASSANALGSGGDITFATGGTLTYSAASAATDYGSRIKNGTSAISLNTNGQDVTLSGIANTNTGGLTKSGAGKLTFTGTNTYSGATNLNGGTIAVYDGTLSTSAGAVSMSASNTSISVLGGTGVTSTWNLGGQQLGTGNNNYTNVQIVIDGDGVEGSALVTNVGILNWGRTASGTAETPSTVLLTDGGQINVTGEVRIGNPYYSENGHAYLTIGGGTATSTFSGDGGDDFYIGYGERTGSKNNVVTVNTNGVLTNVRDMYVGHINNAQNNDNPTTNNQLLVTGGSASMRGLSLGYIQTDTKDATANVVSVTSGGQLSTTGAVHVGRANNSNTTSNANSVTVSGTGSSWNAGNQDVFVGHTSNASAQSNNNVLTVDAGGSLSNVNNLTVGFGTGTETGNQLVVNGSLAATTVTVAANNTLGGSGTINGAVTVNGTVAPGTSIGTLGVTGNTTIAGTLQIEVDGSSVDLLAVNGDVNISAATLSIVPTGAGATLPSYTILTYTGTLAPSGGPFFAEGTLPGGYTVDYSTPGQIKLVSGGAPTGFAAWQTANSTAGTRDQDHDNDGVDNGTEHFLGGDTNTTGFTALPTVANNAGILSVTWTRHPNYPGFPGNYGTDVVVETSATLAGPWTPETVGGNVTITGNDVKYTFPGGPAYSGKNFARLRVTGP